MNMYTQSSYSPQQIRYNILVAGEVTFSTSDLYVVSNFLNTPTVGK